MIASVTQPFCALLGAGVLILTPIASRAQTELQTWRPSYLQSALFISVTSAQMPPYLMHVEEPGTEEIPVLRPFVGSLLGGGVGILAGGLAGVTASDIFDCKGEDCALEWLFWGAVIGESVIMPLGAHLGNYRRGNYLLDLGISSVIGVGGMLLYRDKSSAPIFVATPILQVSLTLLAEIALARR